MTVRTTLPPARRRDQRTTFLLALLLLPTVLGGARMVRAEVATQYQVESDLTCQCGCGLTVHSCNHLNCGSGIPLKKEIAEQISTGKSREDILGYFQSKYGEKILSSPTTTGFNIAAWTVPFVGIALGGLVIGIVLTRWRRATSDVPASKAPTTTDPELRARLERELAELDRRS